MKKINEFRVDFDIDHEQYWRGHGISLSQYDACGTGSGSTLREALEGAAEDLAQQDYDIDPVAADIEAELVAQINAPYDLDTDITVECDDAEEHAAQEEPDCAICAGEWHFYVTIDVTGGLE